jgi:hypothetical protein
MAGKKKNDTDDLDKRSDFLKEEWKEARASIARFDNISVDLRKYGFSLISTIITAIVFFLGTKQPESLLPIVLAPASVMILIWGLFLADIYNEVLLLGCVQRAKDIESISSELLKENSGFESYSKIHLTTFLEAGVQTIKARRFTLLIYAMFVIANFASGVAYLFYYLKKLDDGYFIYYFVVFLAFSGLTGFLLYITRKKVNFFVNEKIVINDGLVVEKIFEWAEINYKIDTHG